MFFARANDRQCLFEQVQGVAVIALVGMHIAYIEVRFGQSPPVAYLPEMFKRRRVLVAGDAYFRDDSVSTAQPEITRTDTGAVFELAGDGHGLVEKRDSARHIIIE